MKSLHKYNEVWIWGRKMIDNFMRNHDPYACIQYNFLSKPNQDMRSLNVVQPDTLNVSIMHNNGTKHGLCFNWIVWGIIKLYYNLVYVRTCISCDLLTPCSGIEMDQRWTRYQSLTKSSGTIPLLYSSLNMFLTIVVLKLHSLITGANEVILLTTWEQLNTLYDFLCNDTIITFVATPFQYHFT